MGRAPELHWNEGDRWSVSVELPTSRVVSVILSAYRNSRPSCQPRLGPLYDAEK